MTALVMGNKVVVSNCGDSRAMIATLKGRDQIHKVSTLNNKVDELGLETFAAHAAPDGHIISK